MAIVHAELLEPIVTNTGARLTIEPNAPQIVTPQIDIDRICQEFGYQPSPVLPSIPELIHEYQKYQQRL
jgi:hypothetical protein